MAISRQRIRDINKEQRKQYIVAESQRRAEQFSFGQENIRDWRGVKPANLRVVRQDPPRINYAAQARRDTFGGILGAASTLATVGAGTVAGASLAPVAVGLGLGYGAFKLGEAVGLF